MKRELIVKLHGEFEATVHTEADAGIEYWYARELQGLLGYREWRSFEQVVKKAITAC